MYTKTTSHIKITVIPMYMADQSNPAEFHYVWAYTIQIENTGQDKVQLLNRYWRITDATGAVQEVRGPGVVGEQPLLEPGDHFQYTSGVALKTNSGIMGGTYEMINDRDEIFLIEIPTFSLDSPQQMGRPN
jgi:ApaG protein